MLDRAFGPFPAHTDDHERLLRHLLCQHFRSVASLECVYSLPADCLVFRGVSDVQDQLSSKPGDLEADVVLADPLKRARALADRIFFRVASIKSLKSWKLVCISGSKCDRTSCQ